MRCSHFPRVGGLAGALATLGMLMTATRPASAGGLGRPTPFSARAYGVGGAFVAIADDPTALHYNPAGLASQSENSFLFGLTLLSSPRDFTPVTDLDGRGVTQSTIDNLSELPVLGYAQRIGGRRGRLVLGIGFWNTFGGTATFPKGDPNRPAIDESTTVVLELVPGLAYEVNDFLSLGVGVRLGLGLLSIRSTAKPTDAEFSALGVGPGATLGAMVRPTRSLSFGVSYRTPLAAHLRGTGTVYDFPTPGMTTSIDDVGHDQRWPAQALLGVSYRIGRWRLAGQIDWTDWSTLDKLVFELRPILTQVQETDFHDSIAVHAGAELVVSPTLTLRAGYTHDQNAIGDRTMQRNYLGGPHHAVAGGVGVRLSGSWRVDAAFEYLFGQTRTVDDNLQEYVDAGFPARANLDPGEYSGKLFTFETNVQYLF